MARKRKLDPASNSTSTSEPSNKQKQPKQQPEPHDDPPPEAVEADEQVEEEAVEEYEEEETIESLLEPFSKEQLFNLLKAAAETNSDVSDRIRRASRKNHVHRKIFVHDLALDTTAETLTSFFSKYGDIEQCKIVRNSYGRSKGYGFILFKTRSVARRALKHPQKKIGDRIITCHLAALDPVSSTPAAPVATETASQYAMRKVYVNNVGAVVNPEKLLVFFEKFGEIEEGPVGLDKAMGRPNGFCLFVYKSAKSAKKVLEEPQKNFEGLVLNCKRNNFFINRNNNNAGGGGGGTPGVAATQALNPALAFIAKQGAGSNLLENLGVQGSVNPQVPVVHGLQGAYGNQVNQQPPPKIIGIYRNQPAIGPDGSGRGPHP